MGTMSLNTVKAAAARLETAWPHGEDCTGVEYHVYTQANAMRDEDMLILVQVLHTRGGKVTLYDANGLRAHPLRTIPSVFMSVSGQLVERIDVYRPEDVDLPRWLAAGGPLSPARIRAQYDAATAKREAARAERIATKQAAEELRGRLLDTLAADPALAPETVKALRALLAATPVEAIVATTLGMQNQGQKV